MWPIVTDRVVWSVGLSVTLVSPAKTAESIDRDAVWVEDSDGPREPCIRWGPDPPWEGAIFRGKGRSIVKYRDSLQSSVRKRLNRLRCCLGYGLGLVERSTSSIIFARWCQCTIIGGHVSATLRIRLNRPSAAAMRPYVKLL